MSYQTERLAAPPQPSPTAPPPEAHSILPKIGSRRPDRRPQVLMSYTVTSQMPTAKEHKELAESVGWANAFWWEAMPASLAGSTCGVVVHHESGELVGMGRVVGDGAFYFYIQDVAVHPDHQGRGLGRSIVEGLVDRIRQDAPGHCFVGLFATPPAEGLYRSLGWEAHEMLGMWRVIRD